MYKCIQQAMLIRLSMTWFGIQVSLQISHTGSLPTTYGPLYLSDGVGEGDTTRALPHRAHGLPREVHLRSVNKKVFEGGKRFRRHGTSPVSAMVIRVEI